MVALLQRSAALVRAVDGRQLLEGALCEDGEAAEVTPRRQAQQVEAVDVRSLHARDVSHGPSDALVLIVDDQGAACLHVSAIARLALARPDLLGIKDTSQVLTAAELLQCLHCLLGLAQLLDAISHHQGQLSHLIDAVTPCHHQGRQAAGSQGHSHGMALLGEVHLAVPAAPDPGGVEHASAAGLVSEGRLASTVGSSAWGAGDTGHGSAGAPGLGGGVVACLGLHCVSLALVLVHVPVDLQRILFRPSSTRELLLCG